ncbi:hypothetical protein YC2023_024877 [Brassica napus]
MVQFQKGSVRRIGVTLSLDNHKATTDSSRHELEIEIKRRWEQSPVKTSGGEVGILSWSRGIEGERDYSKGEIERSKDRREACISGDDGVEEQTIVREDEAVSSSKLLVAKGERERETEKSMSEAKESRWRM